MEDADLAGCLEHDGADRRRIEDVVQPQLGEHVATSDARSLQVFLDELILDHEQPGRVVDELLGRASTADSGDQILHEEQPTKRDGAADEGDRGLTATDPMILPTAIVTAKSKLDIFEKLRSPSMHT